MAKIDELSAENERLRAGLTPSTAHSTLQAIYRDESAPRSDRIKAANGAIGYEQPKLGSILPSLGNINRAERWRVYEMWSQRHQYIIEHRDIPPPNWGCAFAARCLYAAGRRGYATSRRDRYRVRL